MTNTNLPTIIFHRFFHHRRPVSGLLFFLLGAALSGHSYAASLRVSPIGLEIPAGQRAASMTLVNTGNESINLQMRIFKWSQVEAQQMLEPTSELIVTPPAATIPPDGSYTIRVARPEVTPVDGELSYRLLIDEIPKPVDPRTVDQGVSMVLRTSIPIFITDTKAIAQLAWRLWRDTDGLHAEATNSGKRHAKITGLTVKTSAGETLVFGSGLNGYVLAGSRNRFDLMSEAVQLLTDGEQVRLMGKDGPLAIEETLHVESR